MQIVTLTLNPCIDRSAKVPHVAPEEKLYCHDERRDPGGGGINVSRVTKRLGGDSLAIYPSGGSTGQLLDQLLATEGVKQFPVPMASMTRENFIAYDETTTLQYRFGMPGAIMRDSEWQECLDAIHQVNSKVEFLVASGSLPPNVPDDFYVRVGKIAKELGAKFVLDAPGKPFALALEAGGLYMVKPNLGELKNFAKSQNLDPENYAEFAQRLVSEGKTEVVVVSLGAAGAMLITRDSKEQLPAPIVPIRSKVGAGDSMVGGIVLSLAQGNSLRDAVRFGIATGAATVMAWGTQLCKREDVERLFQAGV